LANFKISLPVQNKIIYNLVIFVATKNDRTTKNVPLFFWVLGAVVGSRIRDQGSGMDKIGIRDKHPESATLKETFSPFQPRSAARHDTGIYQNDNADPSCLLFTGRY
jgi:hypothetical protein